MNESVVRPALRVKARPGGATTSWRWAVVAVATFVTLAITYPMLVGADLYGHRWALAHRGGVVAAVAAHVTRGGQFTLLLPVVLAVGFGAACGGAGRRLRAAAGLVAVFTAGTLVRWAVAETIARPRPPRVEWIGPASGYAFPSGHTTIATLGAGVIAWALTRRWDDPLTRVVIWAGAAGYALAVGWSRVWLGVHWPTDVIGSWLLAIGWLTGVRWALSRGRAGGVARRAPDRTLPAAAPATGETAPHP
ncbi:MULTISPECIES: phosphatase PAP2 family protein [Micromonospora]|uniref:phosphatase PAP2 family protein n=1 Tax=Micromonospora TaxID=1873 RepID=UPI001319E096|nr:MULTISPECIES: phosphatase PAP2 family protein [Micromonospora]NES16984.1 phosphatase PAP2 family protein [Micromonospora sp. PPF5-17B]NES38397.1 phosphatase PAP2 family protein [Micromonospora solifontis]NES58735.1 phosphatase PAP2 family protein [Micromonospora sp. PPF5-6]